MKFEMLKNLKDHEDHTNSNTKDQIKLDLPYRGHQ